MSEKQLKRVSDVAPVSPSFEGQKVYVRNLVDKEVIVTRIVELRGEKGPYIGVQIEHDDWQGFFFSAHIVVMRKLKACIGALPLLARISLVEPGEGRNSYFDIE